MAAMFHGRDLLRTRSRFHLFSSSPWSFLQGPGVVRCTPLGYSSVVALLWVVEMVFQSFAILCSRVPRPRIGDCTGLYVVHWIGLRENVRQTGRCSRHPNELEKALVAHVTYFAKAAAVVGNAVREGPNENDACFFEFKFAGNSIYEIRRWRFKKMQLEMMMLYRICFHGFCMIVASCWHSSCISVLQCWCFSMCFPYVVFDDSWWFSC